MLTRCAVILSLPIALAACANETTSLGSLTTPSALLVAQPSAVAPVQSVDTPHKKTMADKVLAAIALERVTGMQPDPARFVE